MGNILHREVKSDAVHSRQVVAVVCKVEVGIETDGRPPKALPSVFRERGA